MKQKRKPAGYWNDKSRCREAASQCKSRWDFGTRFSGAHNSSLRNQWLDEFFPESIEAGQRVKAAKPAGYWTKERCMEQALQHETVKPWKESSRSSYEAAQRNGWMAACTAHMRVLSRPQSYWTRERCIESAQGCDTITAWMKAEKGAYNRAKAQGWFDECVAHMEQRTPAGHWDIPENVMAEAIKHPTRGRWFDASQPSYKAAKRLGIFDECVAHMGGPVAGVLKYTEQDCFAIASRYERRSDFINNEPGAANAAVRYGIYEQVTAHMPVPRELTKKAVAESASQFETIVDWQKADGSAYQKARDMGWFDEVTAHMERQHRECITKEIVLESAKPHRTISDWTRADGSAVHKARKMGWMDEATAHMERVCGHDNDRAYGWLVTAANDEVVVPLPGYHLVKFGVTSQKLGDQRPHKTMKANAMRGEIIAICDTETGEAIEIEGLLLTLGTDAGIPYWYDGYTEFKLVSDDELNEARELLGVA